MYLSRLLLNPNSRQVQSELARPYEMHRTLLRAFSHAFGQDAEQATQSCAERLLFRAETDPHTGIPTVLVQSWHAPEWTKLVAPNYLHPQFNGDNPAVKPFTLQPKRDQLLAFRLRANPTKRLSRSLPRNMDESKRVGLYTVEEQEAWLARKGEQHGFRVIQAMTSGQDRYEDVRHNLKLLGVQFDGILQVTDPQPLTTAIATGIGSGKAFGFGLLSLALVR